MTVVYMRQELQVSETDNLKAFVRIRGSDLVGIANLDLLEGMQVGIDSGVAGFLKKYRYAVVLGAQLGKLGKRASGSEVSLLVEKVALDVMAHLEARGYPALIIHTHGNRSEPPLVRVLSYGLFTLLLFGLAVIGRRRHISR